ncbi:Fpg/Nei family DNA glycosylase [Modestobacter sp. I12A-02628]|uniref:DNA-(apurinic or apyrimidinic site) lyase n=1 Tax=Goekera deserti TaxID=2497753 RepID=A0A7K3WHZ2_9ACTN|nr:Fpg/Nei family DNA glycosylase [Goekera deserti]MPQ97791.1 Fpg/Nei family DNA glycosylase [Goekera deserti]NDI48436.1 Fpg/Nei family DNA glycosylase [Goekera deserti]NEL56037.1 Fpg/Nei family DNA glycosylase [Goekera deserti]
MPEGDSVHLLARRLDRALLGRTLTRSDLRVPRLATADVAGRTVLEHATHGKHLLTRLSGGLTLHTHLRMDGSWTVTGPGRRLPGRLMPDVRVVLETDTGSTAYGIKLPVVELVETVHEDTVVGHLGPDPLRADWDAEEAVRRLVADPTRQLAPALLDQRLMAGFGNLWANELCFLTGHSPWTLIGEVDVPALVRLAVRALRHSAHVPNAYQVTTGNSRRGESHWVAGRARRPCLRCGTTVRVVDEVPGDRDNRRTWWCPHCQPGPGPEARVLLRP